MDPYLPPGYAPFNFAAIANQDTTRLFVTCAIPDPSQTFGQGHGIVNSFELNGGGLRRFAQHGQLNAPWDIVQTPRGFDDLGGTLWIGNFGDGRINAYDPRTGELAGKVRTPEGRPIVIDELWAIRVGDGGNGGSPSRLYFTAGPNGEQDGLFGSLDPRYRREAPVKTVHIGFTYETVFAKSGNFRRGHDRARSLRRIGTAVQG